MTKLIYKSMAKDPRFRSIYNHEFEPSTGIMVYRNVWLGVKVPLDSIERIRIAIKFRNLVDLSFDI